MNCNLCGRGWRIRSNNKKYKKYKKPLTGIDSGQFSFSAHLPLYVLASNTAGRGESGARTHAGKGGGFEARLVMCTRVCIILPTRDAEPTHRRRKVSLPCNSPFAVDKLLQRSGSVVIVVSSLLNVERARDMTSHCIARLRSSRLERMRIISS